MDRMCGVDMRIHVAVWASSAPYPRGALFMGIARKKFVIEIIRNHRSPYTHHYSRTVAGRTFIYTYTHTWLFPHIVVLHNKHHTHAVLVVYNSLYI